MFIEAKTKFKGYFFMGTWPNFESNPLYNICNELSLMVLWNIAAESTFWNDLNIYSDKSEKTNYNNWPPCSSFDF